MAVAIIGGTITSTLLTLLVVPTFYDSIEIAHDRVVAKYRWRATFRNPIVAFVLTFGEAILTLIGVRFVYRLVKRLAGGRKAGGVPSVQTGD
jgi:HAE1 family hydrophobic/amphiphilic exporter-1